MKKILCLLLIMILSFPAFACDKEKTLATPENVKISMDGEITWDKTKNATGYVVTINGDGKAVTENSYKADSNKDFTVTVRATADGYKDSAESEKVTFKAAIKPEVSDFTISIEGNSEVASGQTLQLKKVIKNLDDKSAEWSITEGGEYASIDKTGLLTAKEVDGDKMVKVRLTSKVYPDKYAEKFITILAKTELTQDMLNALTGDKIAFDGFMTIDLYGIGTLDKNKLQGSFMSNIKTKMGTTDKGEERWYAEYERTAESGVMDKIYYKKGEDDDNAYQIGVNFENEEEYFPLTENDGKTKITWDDAGLYNSLSGLLVENFEFNEKTWLWEYDGSDETLTKRVVASANPYEFKVGDTFGLIIDDGEILGITAKSEEDYSVVPGYRAFEEIFVAITVDYDGDIPTIGKFEHRVEHDKLGKAIENMQDLNSYTLDFKSVTVNLSMGGAPVEECFEETVGNDACLFRPYEPVGGNGENKNYISGDEYGFKKIGDNLYNSFLTKEGKFKANRAFEGDFKNAKPSFAFAPEIFTRAEEVEDTKTRYYVSDNMMQVATKFYNDVGNDGTNIYGIYAALGYIDQQTSFTPFLEVEEIDGEPYITSAAFFFNLYIMNGLVEIHYGDFNNAEIPEDIKIDFDTRALPEYWTDEVITVRDMGDGTGEDTEVNLFGYFKDEMFKGANIGEDEYPFFDEVLGDTFGFAFTEILQKDGAHRGAILYYDVAMDLDYTLNSSLNKIDEYLTKKGYTRNKKGEYSNGSIGVRPMDNNLDLMIEIWDVRPIGEN